MNSMDRPTPTDLTWQDSTNDIKNKDPYSFKPAEWFYKEVAGSGSRVFQPKSVTYNEADQQINGKLNPACSHGMVLRFNDGLGYLLIQFMRPRVWRIRFHHINKSGSDFTDYNTRTIVQDTLSKLIETLDIAEQINWAVEIHVWDPRFYVLQSVIDPDKPSRQIVVQLWIQREPFKITAVRSVETFGAAAELPAFQPPIGPNSALSSSLKIIESPGSRTAVFWETNELPIQWIGDATVFSVKKPLSARYTGFGEQGGKRFFKDNVCMNYFNFDNMRYFNVYGNGPYEDSEPLYHSEPYWIEMNAHPGSKSQVGFFIDNYSQICLDLGRSDQSKLRVATRFNSFQLILMAGEDPGHIIRLYTSIIGRPNLKPRFVLGNHQGCYGYDNKWKVQEAVSKYRKYNIPLDGMHIDVDIQRDYRTFTIDTSQSKFPEPQQMFSQLRDSGVKCSTNITPVINCREDKDYSTLNEALQNGYFVLDIRDTEPWTDATLDPNTIRWYLNSSDAQRSLDFDYGKRQLKNHKNPDDLPQFERDFDLSKSFNMGVPFHGGVDYGGTKGAPGHYPNLNNEQVRIWWGNQYKLLFDMGLEFVWQDMTSPCMARAYGDMRSFPFRLKLDSDAWCTKPAADGGVAKNDVLNEPKKAIEIWSLYSYNLHKATYHGLNRLQSRTGKRNYIIGRGSFAGAQRFAGLWTGDNASSWSFLDISVAQVLALGLSGVTIAGADVGGFEPSVDNEWWADPELVIRWYSAYSLLPWMRNHYSAKGSKKFQEPYAYLEQLQGNPDLWKLIAEKDKNMYYSVLPAIRYTVQMRYSLLQLMYDAMFENMINGLPIARAMIITDPLDTSLYGSNQWYTRSQYVIRNDLLVAPALYKQSEYSRRKLYLPYPDAWFPMNLRPSEKEQLAFGEISGTALAPRVSGGTYVSYDCTIGPNMDRLPYITPIYIREGAIIPQIQVRQYVPDNTRKVENYNAITINIYPGKDRTYDMYLDDGVSRDSAPNPVYFSALPNGTKGKQSEKLNSAYGDTEAKGMFRQVYIEQQTTQAFTSEGIYNTRSISVNTPYSKYDDSKVSRDIGPEYRVVLWHAPETDVNAVKIATTGISNAKWQNDSLLKATTVIVPTGASVKATIQASFPA